MGLKRELIGAGALVWVAALASACSSRPVLPPGPPPEYEKPSVMPWPPVAGDGGDGGVEEASLDTGRGAASESVTLDQGNDAG
jgi:hypothetical protein